MKNFSHIYIHVCTLVTCHQNGENLTIINLNSTVSFPVLYGSIWYNFRILKLYVALDCLGISIPGENWIIVETLTAQGFGGFDHKGRDVRRNILSRMEFYSCEILEYRLQKAAFSVDSCAIGAWVLCSFDYFLCGLIGSEYYTRNTSWHQW